MNKTGKKESDFALFWEILTEGLLKRGRTWIMLTIVCFLILFSCIFEICADVLKKKALKAPLDAYIVLSYITFYSLHITLGWLHNHIFYCNFHYMKSLLYQHLVEKYLHCNQKSFTAVGTGRICSIVNKQVDDVMLLLKHFLLELLYNIAYLLFFFNNLLTSNDPIFIKMVFFGLVVGTAIYMYTVCRISLPKKKKLVKSIHSNSNALLDIFRNIVIIKTFNTESVEVERYKSHMLPQIIFGSEFYFFEMLQVLGFKLILFLSHIIPWIYTLQTHTNANSISTATAMYFTEFFNFKTKISTIKNSIYTIFDTFANISGSAINITETPTAFHRTAIALKDRFDVRFERVGISMENLVIFNDFTFTAASGQKIAITGRNGSGKSTVIRALLGTTDCTGKILFSDVDIQEIDEKTIHDVISYVPPTPNLFNMTVMHNLKYGNQISDETVVEKCIQCGVHEMFSKLENGYQTVVGEDSVNVSEGQAQMINVMRGVIKNAPIFLMDEPTSNLDNYTSNMILHIVFDVLKDKTVFLSTHNPAHLAKFDAILNINNKQVRVFTHDEFLADPLHNDRM